MTTFDFTGLKEGQVNGKTIEWPQADVSYHLTSEGNPMMIEVITSYLDLDHFKEIRKYAEGLGLRVVMAVKNDEFIVEVY